MNTLIKVNDDKCVGCNSCVRTCPAPEANITKQLSDGRFITTVDYDKCIACGECVRNCSHGARDYVDDTNEVMSKLGKQPMIVIVAPAIKSVYSDSWKSILDWFKSKNCEIFDVSFGADICTWAHVRLIESGRATNIITQPCAAIVKYIETYQPSLLKNLSPVHSPMLCGVTYIRKYLNRHEPIIALSPCIAKKNEFLETGLVEYNVTFKKLKEYFTTNNINVGKDSSDNYEYSYSFNQGQVGSIYPRPGGLRDNLWLHNPDLDITTSEGVHKVYPELDMYAQLLEYQKPQIFDVLSCDCGCNVGAGTGTTKTTFEIMHTMRGVEKSSKSRRKTSGWFRGSEDKLFKKFDQELKLDDFIRHYTVSGSQLIKTNVSLDTVYESMGKYTDADRHYNCHACGYRSCEEMAKAIQKGLNVPQNCIVFSKKEIQAKHKELLDRHNELTEMTNDCYELSDQLKKDVNTITNNIAAVNDLASSTDILTNKVKELIDKLVFICESKYKIDEGMTSEELHNLAALLGNTNVAFNQLNENISSITSECSNTNDRSAEIIDLISTINDTLSQTQDNNKYIS